MHTGGGLGGDDPLLGDAFRRLAAEAPSDEGLLAGVRAASARAAGRRRLLSASVAVVTVVGVAVAVSASGSTEPAGQQLVLGASDEPAPSSLDSPTTPATSPDPQGTGPSTEETPGPSDTYHGRATSPEGTPIAGLYVYWMGPPGPQLSVYDRVSARTAADGTFALPCHGGWVAGEDHDSRWQRIPGVVLVPFRTGHHTTTTAPNWRPTLAGGGYRPEDAHPLPCTSSVQTTVVPPGAVVEGVLRAPAHCPANEWIVHAQPKAGLFGREPYALFGTVVRPGEPFRLTGLYAGDYEIRGNTWKYSEEHPYVGNVGGVRITVDEGETYAQDLVIGDDCGEGSHTAPLPSGPAVPDHPASPGPEVTPTPQPEPT